MKFDIEKLKFWKKEHIPRADIPEQNDKTKASDRKGVWDGVLLMALEAIGFIALFSFPVWVTQFGFVLGFLVSAFLVVLPLFAILLFRMRATSKRSEQAGQYNPVNLIAFNKEGKKYEDHFFTLNLREVLTKKRLELFEKDDEDQVLQKRIFELKGAFRKKKPLEEFHVLTGYSWGQHVEHNDSTETVNLGSVAIKKDMPTVVLRQIGTYGKYKLPLMRVESSCVSRKDEDLFSASMEEVVKSDGAIDEYRSTTMEEDIVRLNKTIKSQQVTIDKLKDAREQDKKELKQIREIGEEREKDKYKPSKWKVAIPYVQLGIIVSLIISVIWLFAQLGWI